jgi:hypothetical protein
MPGTRPGMTRKGRPLNAIDFATEMSCFRVIPLIWPLPARCPWVTLGRPLVSPGFAGGHGAGLPLKTSLGAPTWPVTCMKKLHLGGFRLGSSLDLGRRTSRLRRSFFQSRLPPSERPMGFARYTSGITGADLTRDCLRELRLWPGCETIEGIAVLVNGVASPRFMSPDTVWQRRRRTAPFDASSERSSGTFI